MAVDVMEDESVGAGVEVVKLKWLKWAVMRE